MGSAKCLYTRVDNYYRITKIPFNKSLIWEALYDSKG